VDGRVLQDAGLSMPGRRGGLVDRFRDRDRVMLAVRDQDSGQIAGFVGRAHPQAGLQVPRYLNSPAGGGNNKSRLLYGLVEQRAALAAGAQLVVVEGPLDALAVTVAGRADGDSFVGVSPCGTAPTGQHTAAVRDALARAGRPQAGVAVAMDPDEAGRTAAARAYGLLRPVVAGEPTRVALPAGQDPAGVLEQDGPAALDTRAVRPRRVRSALVPAHARASLRASARRRRARAGRGRVSVRAEVVRADDVVGVNRDQEAGLSSGSVGMPSAGRTTSAVTRSWTPRPAKVAIVMSVSLVRPGTAPARTSPISPARSASA